jgi:signal transduction histidine kinase
MTGIATNQSHQSRSDEWGRHRQYGQSGYEQPQSRYDRSVLALSSWPLRRKVALALAIPLILAVTLGGLRVAGDLREAANSSASARQVTVLRPAIDYLTSSSRAMVAAQNPGASETGEVKAAVTDLEAAAEELESTRATADLTDEQSRQVDVVLDLSRVLREDSSHLSPGTWVAQLRQLQTGVNRLINTIANAQLEPEPRLQLLAETLAGRFSLAMQQALVATSRSGDTGSLELFAELGAEGAAVDRLASDIGEAEPAVTDLLTDNARRTRTVRTGGTDLGATGAYDDYDSLVASLLDGVDAELAASAESASSRAMLNAGLTLGALLAAIFLALLVSRLLLNPIRRVREGALAVAHEHLPDAVARIRAGEEPAPITPIDVRTQEEVGQLARAVDDLHRQAVVLAEGEAGLRAQVSEMFVTLSRRNTSLVNQQLSLIDALEKDEEDPSRLQSLFRLDHLASRMRRTADSLLVLADAPAQQAGQQGLTVAEAMQAATAGVQDYQRVHVGGNMLNSQISDEAASDVVHLLTELVDNALAYSPPTASVAIESAHRPEGVALDIVDGGLGIPDDALAELNERLRSGGAATADTTRRMGLLVVSRLAQRHGIRVELTRNGQGGTTATVVLPATVLPDLAPQRPTEAQPTTPAAQSTTDALRLSEVTASSLAATAGRSRLDAVLDAALGGGFGGRGPIRPVETPGGSRTDSPAGPWTAPRQAPTRSPAPMRLEPVVPKMGVLDRPLDEEDDDSPIFRSMRSAWLSAGGQSRPWTSSEVEAGWQVAARAVESPGLQEHTPSGLPVRRPGAHLVPGGVTKQGGGVARDPEAIRARLAAHAAGVSRGRHVAVTSATRATNDHPRTEVDPT